MIAGTIIGTIAIVLITVAVGLLVDRKYPLLPKAELLRARPTHVETGHAAGEAPATAIKARDAQIAKLRARRCPACRAAMTNGPDDAVRFGDRELLVLHFTCRGCDATRSLYIDRA